MKKATFQDTLNAKPCYHPAKIKVLFGRRKALSPRQIAALNIPNQDKVWALTRPFFLDTKEKAVRFAVFCAEQCLTHFETRFPADTRPRKAINAAKAWSAMPTEENRCSAAADAAQAAADAARVAARAAAAWAAEAAAWAAEAAAWAAEAAAAVAVAVAVAVAAVAVAAAAARAAADAARKKQIEFLVKLLSKKSPQ